MPLIYLESNAVILHNFWGPQPTLPCFRLQYSISKKTRTTVSLSSMQGIFAESSFRKQAWRNPKEGRVGCLHQNIFTRKVTDIAFTSDFCNNYSHPASPASLYLTSPRPRPTRPRVPYLMSSSPSSRVPKSQVLPRASRCPRPTFIHSRLRCVVDAKFSRWRRRSRNFAGYMLCFSIDVFLSLDRFSQFHKLIFV